jgi:hypothetical protein
MEDIKLIKLQLLGLADKRTDEHDSVHKVVNNAKVLLEFVDGDDDRVRYEGVGIGNDRDEPVQTNLAAIEKEEQGQTLLEKFGIPAEPNDEELKSDQELIFKLWFFVVFSQSLQNKSFYELECLLKNDKFEREMPAFVKQNKSYVDAVRSVLNQRLGYMAENIKKQSAASATFFSPESQPLVEAVQKYLDEKDKEVKLDVEKLKSSPDLGDLYVSNFIYRKIDEQVPSLLQEYIKRHIHELDDVQLEHIAGAVRKITAEEQEYRAKMCEANKIIVDKATTADNISTINCCVSETIPNPESHTQTMLKNYWGKREKQPAPEPEDMLAPFYTTKVSQKTLPFKDDVVFGEDIGKILFDNLTLKSETAPVEINPELQNISTESICITGMFTCGDNKPYFYSEKSMYDDMNEYADEREEDE